MKTIIKLATILLVAFLFSCEEKQTVITAAFHAGDNLVIFVNDGDPIQIPLEDEKEVYDFAVDGIEYQLEWISGGYSFGKHYAADYIIFQGNSMPVVEDNDERDVVYLNRDLF